MKIATLSSRFVLAGYLALATALVAAVVVSVLAAPLSARSTDDVPAIKFNHKFHIKENGIACTDCHADVSKSTLAGDRLRPNHTNCESCHQEQLEKTCTYCHTSEDPLTYHAKPTPPREIVFSHQHHVETLGTACETCHAGIDSSEAAVGEHLPAMTACSTCHDGAQAPSACEGCHTNLASLRPTTHNATDWVHEHKFSAQKVKADCATCHTDVSCQDCHNGTALVRVNLAGTDRRTTNAPRSFPISRGQPQALTKVHDLNFKFTHGVSAKGKTADCQTCHDQQEFCSRCHMSGGNVTQSAFKPANHDVAGFTTYGIGSGGGAHATLAKRDIESCASCHDASGADATCITCHFDNDGVRGTNPRTHARGFMADQEGPWHTDPGANCYVCHTDPNARPGGTRGQNFCGYCHH